jgi:rhamnosyltransferase
MEHRLGDDRVVVLGRPFSIHSPLRHYYAIRNGVWLCLHSRLLWQWKCGIAFSITRRFAAYSLFMPQPLTHFRFMCQGVWHGLCRRLGKF